MCFTINLYHSLISQVLQKLGKADETKDEQFEQVVVNFRRQEVRDVYRTAKQVGHSLNPKPPSVITGISGYQLFLVIQVFSIKLCADSHKRRLMRDLTLLPHKMERSQAAYFSQE